MKRIVNKTSQFIKKHSTSIILILLVVIFFSFSVILTYDSSHYLSYVSIFEGKSEASSWDIVRGPVFPIIIHLSNIIFGKTSTGILICIFLFYLSFVLICHIICKEIFKDCKHKKILHGLLLTFLILNPLILGYYHVLLTEFVSITVIMLNILVAYRWINIDLKKRKIAILYSIYFVFITLFCWHLKQPYIIIAIIPLMIASIISLIQNHKKNNLLYRIGTIIASLVFLIISIVSWNGILNIMNADKSSDRDSSSMLGKQLLTTYQIPYESTKNDQGIATSEAISILTSNFFSNPGRIIKTYLENYCGLTSICEVTTEDNVNYIATGNIIPLKTFENTRIGYATFQRETNIFDGINPDMTEQTSHYSTAVSQSIFAKPMKALMYPTNILFKLVTVLCMPAVIILIIIKIKTKDKKYTYLFRISLLLLGTASLHLALSAAAALVIDRYAVEAFTPSILGLTGLVIYGRLALQNRRKKQK